MSHILRVDIKRKLLETCVKLIQEFQVDIENTMKDGLMIDINAVVDYRLCSSINLLSQYVLIIFARGVTLASSDYHSAI